MTLDELMSTDKVSLEHKNYILSSTLQTLVDFNWPGLKLERLSEEFKLELINYVNVRYTFSFNVVNKSIIAEPI